MEAQLCIGDNIWDWEGITCIYKGTTKRNIKCPPQFTKEKKNLEKYIQVDQSAHPE